MIPSIEIWVSAHPNQGNFPSARGEQEPQQGANPKRRAVVWRKGHLSTAPSPLWLLRLCWAFPAPYKLRGQAEGFTVWQISAVHPPAAAHKREQNSKECHNLEQWMKARLLWASGNGFGRVFFFLTFPNFSFFSPSDTSDTEGFLPGSFLLS